MMRRNAEGREDLNLWPVRRGRLRLPRLASHIKIGLDSAKL
jgi:hypothetical protein